MSMSPVGLDLKIKETLYIKWQKPKKANQHRVIILIEINFLLPS